MAKEKKVVFNNELIKQGNSYCVRVPKSSIDHLKLDLGDTVQISLSKPKMSKLPKSLLDIYRKTVRVLKDFSDKDLRNCFFNFDIEASSTKGLKKAERNRVVQAFEKTVELKNGKEFLKKYRTFKRNVNKGNSFKIINAIKKSKKFQELGKAIEEQLK
ncbi:MAG: hypothetical protein JSW08_01620 [archaeon]|nr:MAG: hypothetical protein JSW08_01620 [archaeon]